MRAAIVLGPAGMAPWKQIEMRDAKAMFLPMVNSPPGTLWEDPMGGVLPCATASPVAWAGF